MSYPGCSTITFSLLLLVWNMMPLLVAMQPCPDKFCPHKLNEVAGAKLAGRDCTAPGSDVIVGTGSERHYNLVSAGNAGSGIYAVTRWSVEEYIMHEELFLHFFLIIYWVFYWFALNHMWTWVLLIFCIYYYLVEEWCYSATPPGNAYIFGYSFMILLFMVAAITQLLIIIL